MTWVTVLTSLFLLLLLTGLVSWFVLYIQFGKSVEKQWATEVLYLLRDAENCVHSENRQIRELKKEHEAKIHSLQDEKFAAHMCDYSVDELEAYPGIGPGTVGKLRAAGFVNLAALQRARIHIHGLGEKRLADISSATRDLLRKARCTFEAGSCRQAKELDDQRKTLSAHYHSLEKQANIRAQAATEFIDRLGDAAAYARKVGFWRWFRPISNEALIPAEIRDAPLPSLDAALRAAEHRIAPSRTAKRSQTPAEAVPVLPVSPPRRTVPPKHAPTQAAATSPHAEPDMPNETHIVLMELTIQFALVVARADGPVTWTERELIQQHLRKRFSYNRALLNRAEALCVHYETAAIDRERCLKEIRQRFNAEHRAALIGFAAQIVAVSAHDAARAAPFLQRLAQSLGVPPVALPQRERPAPTPVPAKLAPSPTPAAKVAAPSRPASLRVAAAAPSLASVPSGTLPAAPLAASSAPSRPAAPPPKPAGPTRQECLELLEIPAETPLSADLVRRQWNLLSERLAPEKVASMGAEFVELAQTKLAALRRAAELLLGAMGEKLEVNPPAPPAQDLRHNPDLDDVLGGM